MRFFFFLFFLLLFLQCANVTSPIGGAKDETPPKLIRSIPIHKSTNYNQNYLQFTFDEYIDLNRPSREIIIIPPVGKKTKFKIKGKSLIIEPQEEWKDSTTYSVWLRGGVQDVTEKNKPDNIRLSFSTGNVLDSLFFMGKTSFSLQEFFPKKTKITVAIHPSDTFNIFKDTPDYFTISDEEGTFIIENLKKGDYYIYAFEDKNSNLIVESEKERYGFLPNPIRLDSAKTDSLHLKLVAINSKKLSVKKIINRNIYTNVSINKPIIKYSLQCGSSLIHSYGDNQSEVRIYNPINILDSLLTKIHMEDIMGMVIDTSFYIQKKKLDDLAIKTDFSLKEERVRIIISDSLKFEMTIKLSKPLKKIIYDSIFISIDSLKKITFNKKNSFYDSIHKKIVLSKTFASDSSSSAEYKSIFIKKGAIISVENDSSKAKKYTIKNLSSKTTGTLLVEVESTKKYYEIQLLSKDGEIVQKILNKKTHTYKNLPPQDYKIRVLIDNNENGKWDYGNIYKREPTEDVYFYKNLKGEYTFPIRANWEMGPLMLVF